MIDAVGAVAGLDADASLVEQTSSALLSVASNGSGLAAAAASSALDSCEASRPRRAATRASRPSRRGPRRHAVEPPRQPLFAAGNGSSNASAGASLGSSVDGILAAQLAGAVAGEYAMTLSSPNLKSSAQRLSPNATTPGEVRALSLDGAASAAELPPSLAGGDAYDASFAEYATDPYAGEDGGGGAALTARVARFGLAPSSAEPASRRRRARRERRLEDAGGAGGSGAGLASVALTIGGGAACDGLPNVIEVVCPGVETACAAWNATAAAWRSSCEAVGGADGATTCVRDVDASGAAAPTDFSTEDEATDAGSVYFKNLTEPPDLSRALIMIYALALLGACVAAHAYGRRLDARDAAAARAASAVAAASDADDDPYEVNDDHDVLTAGWKQNFLTGMDLGHPFYGWYTLYSASVPRPFRAWCCGFEILVFMYALAFETNLLFPDVEEECAGKLNPETCASLKTVLRGKFKGTHVESAPLCQWIPCAEACVMEEPGEDEMSPMSAARRPERGPARRDDGRARRPVCKIFAYLAENYLVAPVPWRCGGGGVGVAGGAPAARRVEPEDEPRIPTLKIDWDETGAPEASPGTLASSAGPESAVADDELLRKLRAAAHALLEGGPPDARESQAPIPEGGAADGDATGFAVSCSVQCDGAACVAPAGAAHTCLSSTLDDAFAVPSMTAACLFGLDRLEDEVFIANVERVVVKRLGRAARWHAELEAADDARAKERAAVAYLRAEMLSKKERTFGRKKTRLWLEAVTFSLVLYFVFIKPIVVLLISVIMPSFVASSVDKARSPLDHPRYPFETPLPESSVFYLLRWHPELAGTRLADHVAAEATGAPRSARDGLTDARVAEIHGAAIPRTSGTAVVLALIALLFGLHEDLQDTLIEEVFTFLPLASGFVAERTPGLESAGRTSAQPSRADEAGAADAEARGAEAAARDDHEAGDAAAERREDAASDRESLDEDILLDVDARRADGAGAADAEARGAEDAASAGDAIENALPPPPQPETLSDYAFSVQAKPEDAPVPSYSDAAYAAAKGAVVRAGVALDSDKVVSLPAGTAVVVEVAEQLPDKKTRYLLVEPVVGWVSRGAVAKAR
ncbi:hypothetical protein JL722_8614 [Aureococcus anophagefferens]|nr:hypothetical protein JL722_8614 [Aureococcus anophagefferens]